MLKRLVIEALNDGKQLSLKELNIILDRVNNLASGSLSMISHRPIKDIASKMGELRIELIEYAEANSEYRFVNDGNLYKLVKK